MLLKDERFSCSVLEVTAERNSPQPFLSENRELPQRRETGIRYKHFPEWLENFDPAKIFKTKLIVKFTSVIPETLSQTLPHLYPWTRSSHKSGRNSTAWQMRRSKRHPGVFLRMRLPV